MKIDYIRCSRCGKQVSNRIAVDLIVRGYIECPECIEKGEKMDRKDNLGVRVGDRIIHKNLEYVIVDVRCDEGMDGAELFVRAFDPNKADIEQQKRMKMEATSNNFLEMFKKLSEGGGPGGIMGKFGIGDV